MLLEKESEEWGEEEMPVAGLDLPVRMKKGGRLSASVATASSAGPAAATPDVIPAPPAPLLSKWTVRSQRKMATAGSKSRRGGEDEFEFRFDGHGDH